MTQPAPHRSASTVDVLPQRLPHCPEAEKYLLGAILIDNSNLQLAETIVTVSDFFTDAFRRIFGAMKRLAAGGSPIDYVTLYDNLRDDPEIMRLGTAFISSLTDGIPRITQASRWATMVRDASALRTAAHVGQAIVNDSLEPHAKSDEVLKRAHERTASLQGILIGHIPGILASEVQIQHVEWVWNSRIPLGKVTVLDGDPGLGKSALSLDLGARVSIGRAMPDGTPGVDSGVLILNAEDGEADTIVPRLAAMGADLTRVRILKTIPDTSGERQPEIPQDLGMIEKAAVSVNARLIVIDPLMAFLPGTTNTHRDQDVRRALAPLARMAERIGAAVLIVRHLNKAADGNPLYRGGGSIGIIGAARCGLLVARDPDDETGERRVLAVTKTNLGPLPCSLQYCIRPGNGSIRVNWCGESKHSAAALLAVPLDGDSRSEVEEAVEFLKSVLEDGPRRRIREIGTR
jgi:AAA domain/DnaB-like helicase N terminal domain